MSPTSNVAEMKEMRFNLVNNRLSQEGADLPSTIANQRRAFQGNHLTLLSLWPFIRDEVLSTSMNSEKP